MKNNSWLVLICLWAGTSWAHNQDPVTVRRAMIKAYGSLGQNQAPKQVFKGDLQVAHQGGVIQVFRADSVGWVFQSEVAEQLWVVAVGLDGELKFVSQAGQGMALEEARSAGVVSFCLDWVKKKNAN